MPTKTNRKRKSSTSKASTKRRSSKRQKATKAQTPLPRKPSISLPSSLLAVVAGFVLARDVGRMRLVCKNWLCTKAEWTRGESLQAATDMSYPHKLRSLTCDVSRNDDMSKLHALKLEALERLSMYVQEPRHALDIQLGIQLGFRSLRELELDLPIDCIEEISLGAFDLPGLESFKVMASEKGDCRSFIENSMLGEKVASFNKLVNDVLRYTTNLKHVSVWQTSAMCRVPCLDKRGLFATLAERHPSLDTFEMTPNVHDHFPDFRCKTLRLKCYGTASLDSWALDNVQCETLRLEIMLLRGVDLPAGLVRAKLGRDMRVRVRLCLHSEMFALCRETLQSLDLVDCDVGAESLAVLGTDCPALTSLKVSITCPGIHSSSAAFSDHEREAQGVWRTCLGLATLTTLEIHSDCFGWCKHMRSCDLEILDASAIETLTLVNTSFSHAEEATETADSVVRWIGKGRAMNKKILFVDAQRNQEFEIR